MVKKDNSDSEFDPFAGFDDLIEMEDPKENIRAELSNPILQEEASPNPNELEDFDLEKEISRENKSLGLESKPKKKRKPRSPSVKKSDIIELKNNQKILIEKIETGEDTIKFLLTKIEEEKEELSDFKSFLLSQIESLNKSLEKIASKQTSVISESKLQNQNDYVWKIVQAFIFRFIYDGKGRKRKFIWQLLDVGDITNIIRPIPEEIPHLREAWVKAKKENIIEKGNARRHILSLKSFDKYHDLIESYLKNALTENDKTEFYKIAKVKQSEVQKTSLAEALKRTLYTSDGALIKENISNFRKEISKRLNKKSSKKTK